MPDNGRYSIKKFSQEHFVWEEYISGIWCEIFSFLEVKNEDFVVEFAAGRSSKISEALKKYEYSGQATVIEPNQVCFESVTKDYRSKLPFAVITGEKKTFQEYANDMTPARGGMKAILVANHPIDDMLLASKASQEDLDMLFDWTSVSHEEFFSITKKVWDKIIREDNVHAAVEDVYNDLVMGIEKIQPAYLVISQYDSITLERNGMSGLNSAAREVFVMLAKKFRDQRVDSIDIQRILDGYDDFNDRHIREQVLNADNWLIIRF